MGAQGTATLNFGVFPGSSVTSVDVAAAGVIATSAVEAWIRPVASADHTAEDHMVMPMRVVGSYLSDGNIRIMGFNANDVMPPQEELPNLTKQVLAKNNRMHVRQSSPMLVGQFNVWWVWN